MLPLLFPPPGSRPSALNGAPVVLRGRDEERHVGTTRRGHLDLLRLGGAPRAHGPEPQVPQELAAQSLGVVRRRLWGVKQ